MKKIALITSLIIIFCLTLGSFVYRKESNACQTVSKLVNRTSPEIQNPDTIKQFTLPNELNDEGRLTTKQIEAVNITTQELENNINGINITNLIPSHLNLNTLLDQNYILLENEFAHDEKILNMLKKLLEQGKYIYIYGENLFPPAIFDQLGVKTVKINTDNSSGQTQIFGIKLLDPENDVYYVDIYWTENMVDTEYLLNCVGPMLNNATLLTQRFLHQRLEAADSYIQKGTNSFAWDYNPYGKVSRVAEVYKQTNDGSDIKDWWYIHHFSQSLSGKYLWNNIWRNRYFYVKDQPSASGMQTNLIGFSPTTPPTDGAISVSIPIGVSWSFNASGFKFGFNKGSITENYVEWVAKPGTLQSYMPNNITVEPGCKFETPQNGTFYNKGHHTITFTEEELLMDQTRTNYLSMQYSS